MHKCGLKEFGFWLLFYNNDIFRKVVRKTFWVLLGLFGCIWFLQQKQASVQTRRGEVKVVLSENAAIKGDIQDASSSDLPARHAAWTL